MVRENRKTYVRLLLGLLLFLLVDPLTDQFLPRLTALVVDTSLLIPIVLGVWGLKRRTRWFVPGMILAAVIVLAQVVNIGALEYRLAPVVHLLALVFFAAMAMIALEDVLFGGTIDSDRLVGAICVYLLFGIAWGMLYAMLDSATVSDALSNIPEGDRGRDLSAYVYYSFVTLTTLGYGDIAPLTPVARVLAYLEAACGQLYLTILVAALVGMLLSRPANPDPR